MGKPLSGTEGMHLDDGHMPTAWKPSSVGERHNRNLSLEIGSDYPYMKAVRFAWL